MPEQKTKNDKAWEILFAERPILQEVEATGIHRIPASIITAKREARLMTKFDHAINLPKLFSDNGLAILPDSRSSYVIGRFECYEKIAASHEEVRGYPLPVWMQSLASASIGSEPLALLCAYHAKMLDDVLGEEVQFTIFGRMSTGKFDFSIQTSGNSLIRQRLTVDKAQCEIDGGFEGRETFAIVEVKNEQVDDFHVRQLYYPYRLWNEKITKRVVPVFLTYSNEIFTFSVYEFARLDDYNSLQLVKRNRYQLGPTEIEIDDIRYCLTHTRQQPEPGGIPFPQADRFERVIDLLARLYAAGGTLTRDEITTQYAFDIRQTQYYTDAGRYLGLAERNRDVQTGVFFSLTPEGTQLMNKAPRARKLALIERVFQHGVFRSAAEFYLTYAHPPSHDEVLEMMQNAGLSINDTTMRRRAQSVIGWIRWMIALTAEAE